MPKRINFFEVAICLVMLMPFSAVANIVFVQAKSGSIAEVSAEKVQSVCGKNFFFREIKKEEAPEYLYKEIVKAAFSGEMLPSIDAVVASLKKSSGKCAWLTPEEFARLK